MNRVELGSVATVKSGFAFKSRDWKDHGVPVIKIANVKDGFVTLDGCSFVDESVARDAAAFELKPGDILISMTGYIGEVARVRNEGRMLLNQRVGKFSIKDPARLDRDYLFYCLRDPDLKERFVSHAYGAAQPNISPSLIERQEIPLPPLPTQRCIAGVLSLYDDLIENSQQRIRLLEAMARVVYRDAVGSVKQTLPLSPLVESPYWRFISENVAEYSGTKRYYATADIDGLAVVGPGIDYSYSEKPSRAQKQPIPHSVWFARMKDTYKIAWFGPASANRASGVILSSGFAGFEAKDPELWPLLFLSISSHEFHVQKDLYCTGATQMSLTNEGLARITVPGLDEKAARLLGRSVAPMLQSMAELQWRISNLRRTRDLLLPRLLSGQIDVESMP